MFNIIIKTVIIYAILILSTRLMGKKQAGQLQPYEFVITLIIAEVASTPMDDPDTPLLYGIIPAVTLLLLYYFITFLSLKSRRFHRILCGRPSILIHNGKILMDEIRRINYSLNDLVEQLRLFGNTSISSIHYAILETNGQLSILPFSNESPLTPKQLSLTVPEDNLCSAVIIDGRFNTLGVSELNLTKKFITKTLHTIGFSELKNILICTFSDEGEIFVQDKKGKIKHVKLNQSAFPKESPAQEVPS